jgi:DNA repair photolyase
LILNTTALIRNRHKDRYFGIDYYANICHGSNPIFNYLSTPLDFYPLANQKTPSRSIDREHDLLKKIQQFDTPKIIGFFDNPDIYQCHHTMFDMIHKLKDTNHGLFIESHSLNILNDMDAFIDFSKTNPLLIGLPIASLEPIPLSAFDDEAYHKNIEKLAKAFHKANIPYGFIIKPVIPYINDSVEAFKRLLNQLIEYQPDFIYPTFSITFDSKKLNHFYHMIDHEHSELKSLYFDEYGYKKSWMSPNAAQLKKAFIFTIKKTKIAYSMKQIIDLYKKEPIDEQISLF